ncbi:MAG: SPOR domain-containing protein [Pseudomonadota bacterium]
MNRNSSSRSSSPSKKGPLLIGILLGMMIGLIIAGGVAWYILKGPSPFMNAPHETVKLAPDQAKPGASSRSVPPPAGPVDASAVGDGKPRFEFYKVLTDKQDGSLPAPPGIDKVPVKESSKETYLLQAGAFNNPDDADKLKAKLAMLGLEANVQSVTLADKVTWHRVRLGPYRGTSEMNKAMATLKQNGIDATPTRP